MVYLSMSMKHEKNLVPYFPLQPVVPESVSNALEVWQNSPRSCSRSGSFGAAPANKFFAYELNEVPLAPVYDIHYRAMAMAPNPIGSIIDIYV